MDDYSKVAEALKGGADPALLCATCPWDRFCMTPPSMTSEEVKAAIDKADAEDRVKAEAAKAQGREGGLPMGMLMTTIVMAGRDTQARICPVLALRLRSGDGERIVSALKGQMKQWDDQAVRVL